MRKKAEGFPGRGEAPGTLGPAPTAGRGKGADEKNSCPRLLTEI